MEVSIIDTCMCLMKEDGMVIALFDRSFPHSTANLWNTLPQITRTASSLNEFKGFLRDSLWFSLSINNQTILNCDTSQHASILAF